MNAVKSLPETWIFPSQQWMCYFTFAVYRETALFYAMSAAALTHVAARACAEGTMRHCRCTDHPNPEDTVRLWRSGTCGDNYSFGRRFTRRFAQLRHRSVDHLHGSLVRHNMIVGIQVRSTVLLHREERKRYCSYHPFNFKLLSIVTSN